MSQTRFSRDSFRMDAGARKDAAGLFKRNWWLKGARPNLDPPHNSQNCYTNPLTADTVKRWFSGIRSSFLRKVDFSLFASHISNRAQCGTTAGSSFRPSTSAVRCVSGILCLVPVVVCILPVLELISPYSKWGRMADLHQQAQYDYQTKIGITHSTGDPLLDYAEQG